MLFDDLSVIFIYRKLDFDTISPKNYEFHLTATDNGDFPKSGFTTIIVSVTDVNDVAPQFPVNETAGIYMTSDIPFSLPVGDTVYIVQATDADLGDSITYYLEPGKFSYQTYRS